MSATNLKVILRIKKIFLIKAAVNRCFTTKFLWCDQCNIYLQPKQKSIAFVALLLGLWISLLKVI